MRKYAPHVGRRVRMPYTTGTIRPPQAIGKVIDREYELSDHPIPDIMASHGRHMRFFGALLSVSLAASGGGGSRAADDGGCRGFLEKDVLPAWTQAARSQSDLIGTMTWTSRLEVAPESGKDDYFEREDRKFWISGDSVKVVADRFDRAGTWRGCVASCISSQYGFIARQEVRGGPFVVTYFTTNLKSDQRVRNAVQNTLLPIRVGYQGIGSTPLDGLIRGSAANVLSCRDVLEGGRGGREISLTFSESGLAAKWDPAQRQAKAVLDTANGFRVFRQSTSGSKQRCEVEVSYVEGSQDPYRAQKVTVHYDVLQGDKPRTTDVFEVTSLARATPSPTEFTLPSVGLPEVQTPAHRRFWRLLIRA